MCAATWPPCCHDPESPSSAVCLAISSRSVRTEFPAFLSESLEVLCLNDNHLDAVPPLSLPAEELIRALLGEVSTQPALLHRPLSPGSECPCVNHPKDTEPGRHYLHAKEQQLTEPDLVKEVGRGGRGSYARMFSLSISLIYNERVAQSSILSFTEYLLTNSAEGFRQCAK